MATTPPITDSVDQFQMALRFSGPDVEAGTIPVDALIPSPQGLATAFRKGMRARGFPNERLVLRQVQTGSFAAILGLPPDQLSARG
ncbi:MAG TPA: hypothetical protein VHZ74_16860 [Bryobacteraceae bacterium]|nr:hypothetical protein [Bryobacteraceae bacterium]